MLACGVWQRLEYLDDESWLWLPSISQNSTEVELQDMIDEVKSDEKSADEKFGAGAGDERKTFATTG